MFSKYVGPNVIEVTIRMSPNIEDKVTIVRFKTTSQPNWQFIVKHAVPCSINLTHGVEVRKGDFPEDLRQDINREVHEVEEGNLDRSDIQMI